MMCGVSSNQDIWSLVPIFLQKLQYCPSELVECNTWSHRERFFIEFNIDILTLY